MQQFEHDNPRGLGTAAAPHDLGNQLSEQCQLYVDCARNRADHAKLQQLCDRGGVQISSFSIFASVHIVIVGMIL